MQGASIVSVRGVLSGVGNNRYKADGKWVDQAVLVFPTEEINRLRIVTIPADDQAEVVSLLEPLVGTEITVEVSPGNFGKLWYRGLL